MWYNLAGQEVLERLQSSEEKGLTEKEARERAGRIGPNQLDGLPGISPWQLFLRQFKDFMVLTLLAAVLISGFLGEYADALTIIFIIVVNAFLGFIQEYRAERSMEALQQLTAPEARIIRDGQERRIPAKELAPGDIVLLEAGDRVPADVRLLKVSSLEIEESSLTGESMPVRKQVETLRGKNLAPGDAGNMAFMGTLVSRGRGRGVVVATGMATEMGRIAGMIQEAGPEETPLQRRLDRLGKTIVVFCLAICVVVAVAGILRGEEAYLMLLTGISLAVAAIPESLPAIVTVTLAIGVQRMIRRHAIVRKLSTVETLGCATVVCADKTGTLTRNEMTVRKILVNGEVYDVTGEGYDPKGEFVDLRDRRGTAFEIMMRVAALCNNALLKKDSISVGGVFREIVSGCPARKWNISGDPTEGALLVMAAKAGVWRERVEQGEERVAELPFDSGRKMMTVVYRRADGTRVVYTKGAPENVLRLCTHHYRNDRLLPLSDAGRAIILEQISLLAGRALRVLAFAYRELPADFEDYTEENMEQRLVFAGLAGMIDPPRPAAVQAVQTCRHAGIKAVMITGDHELTARATARELGLLVKGGRVLSGADLDRMSDRELQEAVNQVGVYARVSPRHKLSIVRALKQAGHVVAMTGDGVNDAPAVKEADIGIAMGINGTDVTKEASAMVLTDDNFSSIVAAVEEGRGIYDNIRKFIRYLLSCNVGEVLALFLAMLAGLPLPLLPIQLLWMNLVTDGLPAIALGIDPADRDIMYRPPRVPQESIFAHGLAWRIVATGVAVGIGTLLAFYIGLAAGSVDLARTIAFNTLVFFQLFYVFACRSEFHTILELGLFTNPYLVLAVAVSAMLQLAANYVPFLNPVFHTVPLGIEHWALVLSISAAPLVAGIFFRRLQTRAGEKIVYLKV